MKLLPLIIIVFAAVSSCRRPAVVKTELDTGWEFCEAGTDVWHPAHIPGCVHTDLSENGLIPGPFKGANEQKLQWIGQKDWKYRLCFSVEPDILEEDSVQLVFEGLDTYATVSLNDSILLNTDNMFLKWKKGCRDLLKRDSNKLVVTFRSAESLDSIKEAGYPVKLPDRRAFSRKAPYHYGWDWGPRFVTCGIWRPVYLVSWSDIRLTDVAVMTQSIDTGSAILSFEVSIGSSLNRNANIKITDRDSKTTLYRNKIALTPGNNTISGAFRVDDPELWWSNGLGDPHLYNLQVNVKAGGTIDTKNIRTGIRTVELVRKPDSAGESFYFRLNGLPVFMKGANWIPSDNFISRITDEKYRKLLLAANDANMNMLRVWGGGIYENDIFYDLCDEHGILVWQDFIFACNMYPGNKDFMESVKNEAEYNIRRLRSHPSIAIWCGNNEVKEGWFNWGWQQQLGYTPEDSLKVWRDYQALFEELLPALVQRHDPGRPYWPSSPLTGWGHEEAIYSGDMHYWGVWWGEEPFSIYEAKTGRFMSEYGFQGFPHPATMETFAEPQDVNLNSAGFLNHQKHPRGMELIRKYMARHYHIPEELLHYNYVSQLVQAYGMVAAIESHRRKMPFCMGTLYWQFNDCWPVISWSGTDYYGRWKALHYLAEDAYGEIIMSFEESVKVPILYCISDRRDRATPVLKMILMDFMGKALADTAFSIVAEAGRSVPVVAWDGGMSGKPGISKKALLHAALYEEDRLITERIHFFAEPRELDLPQPGISHEITIRNDTLFVHLHTRNLAKNVFLLAKTGAARFSDNFFDMLPDSDKTVYLAPADENSVPEIKIITLTDTYVNEERTDQY